MIKPTENLKNRKSTASAKATSLGRMGVPFYCLFVAYCALIPFSNWRVPPGNIFDTLVYGWFDKIFLFDIIQNLLLYIPLGFFAVFAFRNPRRSPWLALLAAFIISCSMCSLLEFLQSFNPARVPSALDIMLNTLSGVFGGILALLFYNEWIKSLHFLSEEVLFPISLRQPIPLLGLMIILAWGLYQWYPFLPSLHPEHLQYGFAPFKKVLHNFSLLNEQKLCSYATQAVILYCCALLACKKNHFLFIFWYILIILSFKALIIGRVLSFEAFFGSFAGLFIAGVLHQLLITLTRVFEKQQS
ncbi:MAG TPA: VanZ family protein [Gammaproteobacteria bacterium]|nr:VanZ family protein [Gammaproteobacteria bacterium]